MDIAKYKHVARAQDFRGIQFNKPLMFDNTRKGFNRLIQWIRTLMVEYDKQEVICGFEPTGHYYVVP